MPSTYTLNNGIELIGTGEQSGTWGDTTNINLELLDTALDGQVSVALGAPGSSGSPNNLPISDGAASNGRNRMITFTDGTDLGATAFVQLTPNDSEKIIYVRNSLSGSRSIILFQGTYNASNDYEVPAGTTAVVYFDGAGTGAVAANVFNNAHFDALNVVGSVTVGGGVTVTGTVDAGTVEFDNLSGTGAVSVTNILDEDNMASNSATALSTQQSIKAYVDAQVGTVDTLAEILANGNTTGGTDIVVSVDDVISMDNGTNLLPSLTTTGDLNTGLYFPAADEVGLTVAGTQRLNVNATGVDITGTVTATGTSVFASLDISGDIDVDGTTNLDIVDIDGAVDMATTLAVAGNVDFNGDLDVDGTTNLDVVDIDGAVNMATTAIVTGVLTTTAAAVFNGGFATAADITFGDNDKAIFGAGNDLQIYHQSTGTAGSYIAENGAGDLRISGNNLWLNDSSGDTYFRAVNGSYAKIYHAGNEKLATSSTGVAVTGNLTATGNVTAVDGTFTGDVTIGDDLLLTGPNPAITLFDTDVADEYTKIQNGGGITYLDSRNGASDGPIVFRGQGGGVNTEYARFTGSGYFGIGTTSPSGKLHVDSGTANTVARFSSTDSVASIYLTDSNTTGTTGAIHGLLTAGDNLEVRGLSKVELATGTTTKVTVDLAGDVGIGTTNPTEKLSVVGNIAATGNVSGVNGTFTGDVTIGDDILLSGASPQIVWNDTGSTGATLGITKTGGNAYYTSRNGSAYGEHVFRRYNGTNVVEDLRIDENGRIGLGVPNPTEKLDVAGNGKFTGPADTSITVKSTGTGDADATLILDAADTGEAEIKFRKGGADKAAIQWFGAGPDLNIRTLSGTGGNIDFETNSVFAMRVAADGNVGIGVGSPTEKLHVVGNVILSDTGTTSTDIRKLSVHSNGYAVLDLSGDRDNTVGEPGGAGITFGVDGTGTNAVISYINSAGEDGVGGTYTGTTINDMLIGTTTNAPIQFGINGAVAATLDTGGNLLVGNPSDVFPSNNTSGSGISIRSDGRYSSVVGAAAALNVGRHTSTGPVAQFYYAGSLVGSISVTASATAFNESSDYRLKKDVIPMSGATERVMALKPVNFAWIVDDSRVDGFIAHEIQAVVPECATGTKDAMRDEEYEVTPETETTAAVMGTRSVPDHQGIDKSKLVPLLTAALQEALTEIAALKVRVAALESA